MNDPGREERIVLGLVCIFVIGIFAWSAEPGFHDVTTPRAQDCYYNLLVQGFRDGHLYVKRDAPPGLASLANPYDPAVNKQCIWDSRYLCHDMSYYQGRLYLYFGATPALTLFWPYSVLTGHYMPDRDAVVIFFAIGFLVSAGLLYAIRRRYFPDTSVWIIVSGVMAMGLATGILELVSSCDVYEVAISCGFAFAMLALTGIWKALHEPNRKTRWLLLASLAYGLAAGSRLSLLFGATILLIPVVQAWRQADGWGSRYRAGLWLVPAIIPIALAGLELMLYNVRRFGNPFEFGWHYELTDIQNTTTRQFSLSYAWFNFRFYFLGPMRWSVHFPFLKMVVLSPTPPGYGGTEMPYSGILTHCPIAWFALAAPLALRGVAGKDVSPLRWFAAALGVLFLACALTICLFFAGSSRYEFDFLPYLILLAVIGFFGLERALEHSIGWRGMARVTGCLLLVYSVFFNAMASVKAHAMQSYLDGNIFLNQGLMDKAIQYFRKASAMDPQSATFHFALGNALARSGQIDETVFQYQRALAIDPNYAEADNNLAYVLLQEGRANDAIKYFQEALKRQPSYQAYYNLGFAYGRNDMPAQAVACYQQAIKDQPQFIPARVSLAWILATCPDQAVRNGKEAVALMEEANRIAGGTDPKILRTLAAAYAEAADFPDAIIAAQKALALARAQSKLQMAGELENEIELYQKKSPCRVSTY